MTKEPGPTHDRAYRSPAGIAGGCLLLALGVWLGIDAVIGGSGRTPWVALAGLLLVVPLVVAFTLRPAVFAGEDRLRIRNPFRAITLPWSAVSGFRSGYSNEVFDQSGIKYQLWSIPVSLRGRKKAQRNLARAAAADDPGRRSMIGTGSIQTRSTRAATDQVMDELRELSEARAAEPTAQGEPAVRWAYEIIVPAAIGAVLLAVLLATG
ncbi:MULTISPECIES: PH domain-containing protein [unclassified Streptomyces]|uniref:PH domain-containing protein n=1 Tax=unclassified Streptomyces TaxID=2593676 RepID=UPI000DBAB62A|nr:MULTISPECIES: PH domain-containing protein [unclassified Streptomyces]MYT68736.1 PH domain-containing protein [Streptomyces sp. SID8367]RAJ86409.1 PH (Pleckstrin Homology) domain-containing protein [Streptomyces sp. PsTaAH-137]